MAMHSSKNLQARICLENAVDKEAWQPTVHGSQRVGHDRVTEHTHVHTSTHMRAHRHTCMCTHMHAHMHTHTCTCAHTCTHTQIPSKDHQWRLKLKGKLWWEIGYSSQGISHKMLITHREESHQFTEGNRLSHQSYHLQEWDRWVEAMWRFA